MQKSILGRFGALGSKSSRLRAREDFFDCIGRGAHNERLSPKLENEKFSVDVRESTDFLQESGAMPRFDCGKMADERKGGGCWKRCDKSVCLTGQQRIAR